MFSVGGSSGKKALVFKMLLVLSVFMLFWGLKNNNKSDFMELPTVEIVHAEADTYSGSSDESERESINEKEKIIDDFLISLKEREKVVDGMEKELDLKYENLKSVKSDIKNRLEELSLVKAGIEKAIEEQKAINEANITKLAKVYQSTPPEQAGPMLSRLDAKIAAQIILKMNNMKAGKIWGFVDPKKAVLISNELTK